MIIGYGKNGFLVSQTLKGSLACGMTRKYLHLTHGTGGINESEFD
jgi:hypothetical protein